MTYKNVETGAIVTTDSVLSGAWEPVKKGGRPKKEEKAAASQEVALMANFASVADLERLWRNLKPAETERAEALLEIVSDSLRFEAEKVGKNLDEQAESNKAFANVLKS